MDDLGLDAMINCENVVITVCLTEEPHLDVQVDFDVGGEGLCI